MNRGIHGTKKIAFALLFAALMIFSVFSIAGCEGKLSVNIKQDGLHEGQPLPEIEITSQNKGTVKWQEEDAVLKNGTNKYLYVYTAPNGKQTTFEITLTASAHSISEQEQVIKEPSCVDEGIKAHLCTVCEAPYDMESIPMVDHDYSETEKTESNCVTLGLTYFKCKGCGGYRLDEKGEKYATVDTQYGPHKFELNEDGSEKISAVITAATCQKEGSGIVACTLCDHRKEVTIEKVAHDLSLEKHTEGDCRDYGYTEYFCIYNCNTQRMQDDGKTPYIKEDTTPGPHKFTVTKHTDGDCVHLGYTETFCSLCDTAKMNEQGTETEKQYDTKYGEHVFEKNPDGSERISTVIEPATCQREGSGLVACTLCDHRKEVTIEKADHDFTLEKHTEGDCQTLGYTEYFCIFSCGTQKREADGVTPYKVYDTEYGPHDFSQNKYTEGNCCVLGYTETLCTICGDYKMDGDETYKQYDQTYGDHVYETDEHGNYVVTPNELVNPPTCQKEGSGYVYCIYDTTPDHSHKKLVSVPKTDHEYEKKVPLGGEDCQHEHYIEYHCIFEKCERILMDEDDPTVSYKEWKGTFGPHQFVNSICKLCGELDTVVMMWNFGPANAAGFTTDANGYSDAVIAYLIARADNEPGGIVYYDLVIKPSEGYTGPTYMAANHAYIPWFSPASEGSNINTNTYALHVKTSTVCEGITAISPYMFSGMTSLVTTEFPDSLTVGVYAEGAMARLAPEKEVRFGDYLFYRCKSLENLINVPSNITHIGDFAFNDCESITTFPFGTELKAVGRETFRYCDSLTAIDLADCSKLESIGYNTFEFCPLNSYIVLPHDRVDFGAGTLGVCFGGAYQNVIFVKGDGVDSTIPDFKLTEVIYIGEDKEIEDVLVRDNERGIFYIDTKQNPISVRSFSDYSCTKLDSSILSVTNQVFTNYSYDDGKVIVYSAVNVTTQKLQSFFEEHDDVVRIGSYAFTKSEGLESVTLPDSVRHIAPFAFEDCTNLTELKISESSSLEYIGACAFDNSAVSDIYLPQSLETMGIFALANMSELSSVTYDCGLFDRYVRDNNTVKEYGNNDPSLLYNTATEKSVAVKIGENATEIIPGAFKSAAEVSSVDFTEAKSLSEIGAGAFQGTSIPSVDLTASPLLTKVGDSAFDGTRINGKNDINYLPDTLTSIGNGAFNGETLEAEERTEELVVGGKVIANITYKTNLHNIYHTLVKIEPTADICEFAFVMNDSTVVIEAGAFDEVKAYLTEIDLSCKVTNIPGHLFEGCTSLSRITVPVSVSSFGQKAFYQCSIDKVIYEGSLTDWLSIDFSLGNPSANPIYVGENADGADLYLNGDTTAPVTEIVIPASVTEIKSVAFAGAKITKLAFEDGSLCTKIGSYAFSGCRYLEELTIPESLVTLGEAAFKNTTGLRKLYFNAVACADLTNTLSEGYNLVFQNAGKTNGIELIIGEAVTVIPKGIFYPDNGQYTKPKFTSMYVLSSRLVRIGEKAFYGTGYLTKAYIKDMDAWLKVNFDFGDIDFYNTISDVMTIHPLRYVTELYVYNTETEQYEPTDTLEIKGNVKRYAILGCPAITTVIVREGAVIADYAFYNKSTLEVYAEKGTTLGNIADCALMLYASSEWCELEGALHIHTWGEGNVVASDDKHPTCTEAGLYTFECTVCEQGTKQAVIEALGHSFGEITPEDPATCTREGMAEHYKCEHDGCEVVAVSDGEGGHTVVDKESLILSVEHDYDTNNWLSDEQGHWHKCKSCDATSDYAEHTAPCVDCGYGKHVHEWDEGVYTDPTCITLGYTTYTCKNTDGYCEELTKQEEDAESGYAKHEYDASISENVSFLAGKEPSCTATGVRAIKCKMEGCDSYTTEFALPTHTWTDSACTCGAVKAELEFTYTDSTKTATLNKITNLGSATYIEIPNTVKHTPEGGEEADYKVVIGADLFSKNATNATGDMGAARANVKYIYVDAEAIPNYCFYYYKGVETLYLGEHVRTVGTSAFHYANGIKEMYIDSVAIADCTTSTCAFNYAFAAGSTLYVGRKVESIPAYLFYASSSSDKSKLSTIEFVQQPSLTSIGAYAFRYCALTTVDIPNGVTEIGDYAFYYCSAMKELTIPESVSSIGKYAFSNCSALETVNMYCKNTTIGSSAFSSTSKIKKVNIASIADWMTVQFSDYKINPLSVAKHLYLNGVELTELTVPEGTTAIGNYAFYGASGIQSVVIPDSVEAIGSSAFYNNTSLKTVTVGNGVTSIGSNAFYGCTGLTGVYIEDIAAWCGIAFGNANSQPLQYAGDLYLNGELVTELVISGVPSISTDAFFGCTSIISVTVGDGVQVVGDAFNNCESLEAITVGKDVVAFEGAPFANTPKVTTVTVDAENTKYHVGGNCIIETGTKTLTVGFACSTIPADGSVEIIGDCAFYGALSLENVVLPDNIIGIGIQSFADCSNLKSIVGNGVKTVGYQSFTSCSKLTRADFPALTTIGEAAFAQTGFLEFTIPAGVTTVVIENYGTFQSSPNLLVVYNKSSLELTPEHDMFYQANVRAVHKVDEGDRFVEENGYKFLCKSNGTNILVWYSGSEKEISLPTQIDGANASYEIGGASFCATSITKLHIPSNVTKIGDSAFYVCTALAEVTIDEGVTFIDQYAFASCTALTQITVPASVVTIADYAFCCESSGISRLATVVFAAGSRLETIGARAFYYCDALTQITIPAGVKSLGTEAFRNCKKLEYVYFEQGSVLTTIGTYAFYGCSALKEVVIPSGVTSIGSYAFSSAGNSNTLVFYEREAGTITNGPSNGKKYNYSAEYKAGSYWRYVDGVPTVWTEADAPTE